MVVESDCHLLFVSLLSLFVKLCHTLRRFCEIISRGRRPRRPEKHRIVDIEKIEEKCAKLLNAYYDNIEVDRCFIMLKSHLYYVICVAKRGVEDVAPYKLQYY